jgi:hypothetical protein
MTQLAETQLQEQSEEIMSEIGNKIRVFLKLILSSPCFWASFHPLSPL